MEEMKNIALASVALAIATIPASAQCLTGDVVRETITGGKTVYKRE